MLPFRSRYNLSQKYLRVIGIGVLSKDKVFLRCLLIFFLEKRRLYSNHLKEC
ncbi:hypothetical protein LEP1GSC016_2423 [Leptospira borgpetersenii serovar Hardjo-bovis str. Sponselee]|uniref:Uncharacterized protein n=7 Tax=Leptospira borgpetersenii TaxID=174 RepID=M3GHJ4_LEPBO|nr:hypothetical protein LBBP_03435 [Leptospira borgpetersenii serovar Ballum]EKP14447.1 hypothetical protein LEP1GSC128_1775 [Leptospira borgpetersenii str. 200801926]EKQ92395.1 hypothetical protein LEP1GSC101_2581 [Leptospira borgpetersenii str. UI 09149]EKQ99962.1 hypothetical protein LEP1GSC121_1877 [Leptospira borgpetersenii serovar Castellonis str. 200801910]EMG00437.1 hypothetical protein LEP1GSC123_2409 [Leptospira borgpetersenii str. 200701203]EMJ78043.1 hypothetical protein LEP1GSC016